VINYIIYDIDVFDDTIWRKWIYKLINFNNYRVPHDLSRQKIKKLCMSFFRHSVYIYEFWNLNFGREYATFFYYIRMSHDITFIKEYSDEVELYVYVRRQIYTNHEQFSVMIGVFI